MPSLRIRSALWTLLLPGLLGSLSSPLPAQVVISEFMADNKTTLNNGAGVYPDWIELYNTASIAVNLGGWALTDDPMHTTRWFFPSTNLPAKGFLVVFASGDNQAIAGAPLHTDFSLRASGEYLALLKPDGTLTTEFAPAFPEQVADFSYGMAQSVTTNTLIAPGASLRVLIPTASSNLGLTWTLPDFPDSSWRLGLGPVGYETAVAGFAVTNYQANVQVPSLAAALGVITNAAQQTAVFAENSPTINYYNSGGNYAHYSGDTAFPGFDLTTLKDWFVIRAVTTVTIPQAGDWTFGVNSDDGFGLTIGSQSSAYPGTRGGNDTLATFNFAAPGDYPLELIYFENTGGAEVEFFAAKGSFTVWDSANFKLVGAAGGLEVKAPVVSGGSAANFKSLIRTDVQSSMLGNTASAYIRVPFQVATPASLSSLTLRVMYDDGFVAYLNGTPVASRNAPASTAWSSSATASHPNYLATTFEDINVSDYLSALRPGTNWLAVQTLNRAASDSDFLFGAELVEYQLSGTNLVFFSKATPGAPNGSGGAAFVADTKFSVDRGFFDTPFSMTITSATPGCAIYYTTNGSAPSPTNGYRFSAPLTVSGTTVLRAGAFKDGYYPSGVDTHTYLFLQDVLRQSPTGGAPNGWPSSWGANVVDYGMDPDVVNSPTYGPELIQALKSIPSFSIVTDLNYLFDPTTGIYANAQQDGIDWERPTSLELLNPDGTGGFQLDAGLRIRGGYSRSPGNPKHAFRFLMRAEYGDAKLKYPLFERQNGTDLLDAFDLRTAQNYSWSFEGDYRFIGLRDQFSRDTQLAQGQQGERGDFYHLYINGQYWGLYNTDERGEASYGATYFGGDEKEYDVVKVETGGYTINATDGNMDAWLRLWQAATNGFSANADYFKIQGLNPDGSPNPGYENLIDVDNLIDYMLIIFYGGNIDAPISDFLGNASPNNMYCLRNRTGLYGGFRFLAHDGEHTLHHESTRSDQELTRDRITGPFDAGDPQTQGAATAFLKSNPQYIFTRLRQNPEFRLRVADAVQKQFFNGGVLTVEANRARLTARSNEIYHAVVAESARWGDSKKGTGAPMTRADWSTEMTRVYESYFGQRGHTVLQQLKDNLLYPTGSTAPSFNQFGGIVDPGFQLSMSASAGTVYYTLDGTDPRLIGGGISPGANRYSGNISLAQSVRVKARTLNNGAWSALTDATFYLRRNFNQLLVTEVMYHPLGTTNLDGDEFEFLELKNAASTNLDLSGVSFTNGIRFSFPVGTTLAPGQFAVLVANPATFTNRYPGVPVKGTYSGRLSNGGELLTLVHASGVPIASFSYGTKPPWPLAADGTGFSIVPVNPNGNAVPNDAANWRASSVIGGTPAADDLAPDVPRILITEALTHTDPPQFDSVELYNPHATNVWIAGWYLTDDPAQPKKFKITTPQTIGAYSYATLSEAEWFKSLEDPASFRLDSHGEQVYLFSADADGNLTGYSHGFAFGAAQNGVSFGRYVISTGEEQFPAQLTNSFGSPNPGPRIGPVVINEIQYHPVTGHEEFIELKNISNQDVDLFNRDFPTNTWRLNGSGFSFPQGARIPAGGILLVVGADPASFRAKYSVAPQVQIFGPMPGALQDGGENLSLQRPDNPDLDPNTGAVYVPYIDVDAVRYNDAAPWPVNAAGKGASLERKVAEAYGNDPANWRAGTDSGSPGLENNGNRLPIVTAGFDRAIVSATFPAAVQLDGDAMDDGLPDPPAHLNVSWSLVSGPAPVWFTDDSNPATTAYFPGSGTYVLRLTASDSVLQVSDDVVVRIERPMANVTLIPWGVVWKYLDNGSNQSPEYAALTYDDASWKSGPAPLGYGDANGIWPATTNGYGGVATSKYITTYYRRSFELSSTAGTTNLQVSVKRDDGILVYLNGTPILTNNLPNSFIGYLTNASGALGGADEVAVISGVVPANLLRTGANVIAAEVHQSSKESSDIFFDLTLTAQAYPNNAAPSAYAGADQVVTGASTILNGSASDDGLPITPGILTFAWSKATGPGTVTFANGAALTTAATFSAAGEYTLKLAVTDGVSQAFDTLDVIVSQPELRIDSFEIVAATGESRIRFRPPANVTSALQASGTFAQNSWVTVTNVPALPQPGTVEAIDKTLSSSNRFYRLVCPAP